MSRRLVDKNWASRNLYLERGDLLLLLEDPIKPLVTARTRHGRNIRVPLSILSKDCVQFDCQLCGHPSFSEYSSYTAHLIEQHFRDQLLMGLDNTGSRGVIPSCPFPVCNGTLWGSLEALLMHYASHHHVLEKLMMYESEKQCVLYRAAIKDSDDLIMDLKEKVMKLEEASIQLPARRETKEKDTNTLPELDICIKEEKDEDIKTMIKKETAAATSIENQTLKMEFLQLKLEKERVEKALEAKTQELENCKAEMQVMSKDQKNTVDMCKQWKEVCLAEETKHTKEYQALKDDLTNHKREIDNLKNIIEIGKSTVEHAKQLSTDLAKDNKKRQLTELELERRILNQQENIKCLEVEVEKCNQERERFSDQVVVQHNELSTKAKENSQLVEDFKDLSSKYESSIEVIKQQNQEIHNFKYSKENDDNLKKIQIDKLAMDTEVKLRRENERKTEQLKKVQESLLKTNRELEGKKREFKEEKDKYSQYRDQCASLENKEKKLRQEVEYYEKQVEGFSNLKTQHDKLKEKYEAEKEARQTESNDFKASRDHFEEQTNLLLADMDSLKTELNQYKERELLQKPAVEELELDVRMKSNYIGQLLDEVRTIKGKLERCDEMTDKMNNKIRQCEKMSAELKVQGWEIENYKNKLISFEMIVADLQGLEKQAVPKIVDTSSLRVGSNNNHELAENEYQEISQDSLRLPGSAEVKVEVLDIEEEKDITPEQRDGNKRCSSTSSDTPDPKKLKH